MKLWLDDIHQKPKGYDLHAKTVEEAWTYIINLRITHISFDHDLGKNKLTGYDLACRIEKAAYQGIRYVKTWDIHSANPVGAARIKMAMESFDKAVL